jgi:hypothetical protein
MVGYRLMKKLKCENCIIQVMCTDMCLDFIFQIYRINNEIRKNELRVKSQAGHRRKRLKDKHLLHYNTLVKKFNRAVYLRELIWDRQFKKKGVISASSTPSSGGGSSSSSLSTIEKVRKMSITEYYRRFYKDNKSSDIIKLKTDIVLAKGARRWFRKRY